MADRQRMVGMGRGRSNVREMERSSSEESLFSSSSSSYHYYTRPEHLVTKEGETGHKIPLFANYFRVERLPDFQFLHYHVDFEPQNDSARILNSLIMQQREIFGGYIFDGGSALYLTKALPEETMKFTSTTREGDSYTLTLKKTEHEIAINSKLGFNLLNMILRRAMSGLNLQLVRRNLFDPQNKIDINEHKLSLWPGYVTSIREHGNKYPGDIDNNILLCCEISHKVLRKETIYDILRSHLREDNTTYKARFSKEVIGSVVLTGYNNKTYRIDDIDWTKSPASTFPYQGKDISFVEYYRTKYNININDAQQPLLVSNPSPREVRGGKNQAMCLIPELCSATGLTDSMRMNFQLMKSIAEYTRMDPKRRVKRLLDFNNRLNTTDACKSQFKAFQTELELKPIRFQGRQLPQETIVFGNGKTAVSEDRNVDWTNPMKMNSMFQNETLTRWGVIYPKRCEVETRTFIKLLGEVARGMQYDMKEPKMLEMNDDRISSYNAELTEFIRKDPKFVMVVLPNNSADRYSAVKKISCIDNAIPIQVVVSRTMQPKRGGNIGAVKSIATKVLIQMNCKLGGAAWSIKYPLNGTMTIGFDVGRDTITKHAYGVFVATMDIRKKIEFFSSVAYHANSEECSGQIKVHMIKALIKYFDANQSLPERVIMYRDGVGDGDIAYIREQEVNTLEKTITDFYNEKNAEKPKFCFIIVSKRINTRIFTDSSSGPDNPNSGVVVDNTITLPERYDFYLISQSVRQGTVSPTSYNVIYDTLNLPPERLQILTYKMCHLYYNWSGPTRVPCVLQYAQKLAVLVGQYLHSLPNDKMDNKLYYL